MGQAVDSCNVFLSYHGPDREPVTAVSEVLRKQRISIFWTNGTLSPDDPGPRNWSGSSPSAQQLRGSLKGLIL